MWRLCAIDPYPLGAKECIMKRFLHYVNLIASFMSLTLLLPSCGGERISPAAGELYSVETGDGTFSIVKVLAFEDGIVHIRLYKNRFATRPEQVDTSQLSLGTIDDEDGFGVGHLPISVSDFTAWDPRFLLSEKVTEEELEGYRFWQEEAGGSLGD
jgi:hypothetical protein